MRVVLHIGTEKTATTTIQEFVYHNFNTLQKHGIALSNVLERPNNRKLPSFCAPDDFFDDYFKDRNILTPEAKEIFFKGFKETFKAEVENASKHADTMFISSEHFHSRLKDSESVNRVKALLEELFDDIKVICYFKEQSKVLSGIYSTSIKVGSAAPFEAFSKTCFPESHYYNYHDFCNKWASVFGKERFTAKVFSREGFHDGDIRKDILKFIKDDIALDDFDYSISIRNKSFGQAGIELGRINNRINNRAKANGSANTLRKQIMDCLDESSIAHIGDMPFPKAESIYNSFLASNTAFAKEYLGLEKTPFSPPKPPLEKEGEETIPLSQALSFFEAVLKEVSKLNSVSDIYASHLRDIAFKIEQKQDVTLHDTKTLLELAYEIRPNGNLIKQRLEQNKEKLKDTK